MFSGPLPLLLIGVLAVLALLIGLLQGRRLRQLRRELAELRQQLTASESAAVPAPERFSANLRQAERSQVQPAAPRSSTEKYRYVASMAAQGMSPQSIAEALKLGPAEVEQLLQLARLRAGA